MLGLSKKPNFLSSEFSHSYFLLEKRLTAVGPSLQEIIDFYDVKTPNFFLYQRFIFRLETLMNLKILDSDPSSDPSRRACTRV